MQCRHYLHYLTTKLTVTRVFIAYNTNNADNTPHTSSNFKIASMGRKTDSERNTKSKTKSMNTARMVLIVLNLGINFFYNTCRWAQVD